MKKIYCKPEADLVSYDEEEIMTESIELPEDLLLIYLDEGDLGG